jgi:hypothetical protein
MQMQTPLQRCGNDEPSMPEKKEKRRVESALLFFGTELRIAAYNL